MRSPLEPDEQKGAATGIAGALALRLIHARPFELGGLLGDGHYK